MMESGMVPYDSRPVTSGPLHRPMVAPQFFTSTSYSPGPMTTMAPSNYQPQLPFTTYGSYPSSLTTTVSPFKERPQPPLVPMVKPDVIGSLAYSRDRRASYVDGSPSPSVKSEAQLSSTRSVASSHSTAPRTITTNVSVNGTNQIEFNTSVDALMKAIQSKDETDTIVKKVDIGQKQAPKSPDQQPPPPDSRPNRKRYQCDIPGCTKAFYQKTHLDIHRRAHTGDKPYICKLPGCGQRFSQLGNLRTHERRHTGERPYVCDQCGKRFAQRGNVRAHLRTHLEAKPFQCKLDGCNKNFTQLGNLKSHQNKFHKETLKALTDKFASIRDYDSVCKADRELWEYFATLYKNSNKGIKGRGKDRRVGAVTQASPIRLGAMIPSHFPMLHQPAAHQRHHYNNHHHHHHHQATQHLHHPLPHPGLSHPAAYSISRPSILVNVGRDTHGGYEMFGVEDGVSSGSGPSASNDAVYEDDHGRELAFGDRIY